MKDIKDLLKRRGGVVVELGCGENKADPTWIGIDSRELNGVDIVHNLEKYPWPLPDECCTLVHSAHLLEHINPATPDPRLVGLIDLLLAKKVVSKKDIRSWVGEYDFFGGFIRFMDEVWRITKPGGKFHFVVPYGESAGFQQDPTHVNPINEVTMAYFDPSHPSGLWNYYKPKPWKIEVNLFQLDGILEVTLKKITDIPNETKN